MIYTYKGILLNLKNEILTQLITWKNLDDIILSKIRQKQKDNDKKTKSDFKTGQTFNRHFTKENIQTANTHVKRCPISYVVREMLIKATMRYPASLLE